MMRWLLPALGLLLLTACGQTGPLYLPTPALEPLPPPSSDASH
jgi:predicted small lipoprotein YifL